MAGAGDFEGVTFFWEVVDGGHIFLGKLLMGGPLFWQDIFLKPRKNPLFAQFYLRLSADKYLLMSVRLSVCPPFLTMFP